MKIYELKKTAIEALSSSDTLFQENRLHEAADKALAAWNTYNELQKQRCADEDFTDLIYAARAQYDKCIEAVKKADSKTQTQDKLYAQAMEYRQRGMQGDHKAAMLAADWFADQDNWPYLQEKDLSSDAYLGWASELYQSIVNNPRLWIEFRTLASFRLGRMFLLPMFGNVDMATARKCFLWAAEQELALDQPTERLLQQSLERTIETSMYLGDVKNASRYAQISLEHGADMGIFFFIAYFGLIHNQKTAIDLINAMAEQGTWQGLLLKAMNLWWLWQESECENEEVYDQMSELVNNPLSIYYDEHPESEGGNACLGFCIFKLFMDRGIPFLETDTMQYLIDSVNEGYVWAYNYYGQICNTAAVLYSEQEDSFNADKYSEEARRYLCIAANYGNREALKYYYRNFIEGKADATTSEQYRQFAMQYDIKV